MTGCSELAGMALVSYWTGVIDVTLHAGRHGTRIACTHFSGSHTSAAMPDLNTPCGSSTRTLKPNTWCRRSSIVCTLRGVNSLAEAM